MVEDREAVVHDLPRTSCWLGPSKTENGFLEVG